MGVWLDSRSDPSPVADAGFTPHLRSHDTGRNGVIGLGPDCLLGKRIVTRLKFADLLWILLRRILLFEWISTQIEKLNQVLTGRRTAALQASSATAGMSSDRWPRRMRFQ